MASEYDQLMCAKRNITEGCIGCTDEIKEQMNCSDEDKRKGGDDSE